MINSLDWFILLFLAIWLIRGYMRGFITQLVSLIGLFIAWIAAYLFYRQVAPIVAKFVPLTSWEKYEEYELVIHTLNLEQYFYNALAFALIFFAVKIGLTVVSYLLNFIAKTPGINILNKLGGFALALIEAVIIIIIVINVMDAIPTEGLQMLVADSKIALYIEEHMPLVVSQFQKLWMKYSAGV